MAGVMGRPAMTAPVRRQAETSTFSPTPGAVAALGFSGGGAASAFAGGGGGADRAGGGAEAEVQELQEDILVSEGVTVRDRTPTLQPQR